MANLQSPVLTQRIWGAFSPTTGQILGVQTSGESVYQNIPNMLLGTTFASVRTATHAATQAVLVMGKNIVSDGSGGTFAYNPADTSSGCVCTGGSAGTVLTVISVQSGTIVNGYTVSSSVTGLPLATITSFGTGTGGTGTYNLSTPVNIASPFTFLIDNNSTVLVSADGSRWDLTTTTAVITGITAPSGNSALSITTPLYTFGNATDNPAFTFAGTGALSANHMVLGVTGSDVIVGNMTGGVGILQTTRGIQLLAADAAASSSEVGVHFSQPFNSGTAMAGNLRLKRGTANTYNGLELTTTTSNPVRICTNSTAEDAGVAITYYPSGGIATGALSDPGAVGVVSAQAFQVNGIADSIVTYQSLTVGTSELYVGTALLIPANALLANSTFRCEIAGTITSTHADNLTVTPRLGPNGVVGDAALTAVTTIGSGSTGGFIFDIYLMFSAVGASGTCHTIMSQSSNGSLPTNASLVAIDTTGTTCNTTIANKLGFSMKTAAATTSILVNFVSIERMF